MPDTERKDTQRASTKEALPRLSREPTVTNKAMLVMGSDHEFRKLLYKFFTIEQHLSNVRSYFGRRLGITGPQFNLLMAVQQLQGSSGVGVRAVAEFLHVTVSFIVAESRKLEAAGFIDKRTNEKDARATLMTLTAVGGSALEREIPEIQRINDAFFPLSDQTEFESLCSAVAKIFVGSKHALALIESRRHLAQTDDGYFAGASVSLPSQANILSQEMGEADSQETPIK
jgi:DNA-binding MarR family transcriptional regulator